MMDELAQLQDLLGDRYAIEREMGGGGMSRVYLATERALARRVVIKVLAPELGQRVNVERFQQEIATSATLQHPQIVPVYHAGAAGELRYYVMPFVAGESLRARLRREGRLAPAEVVRLLKPLARALAYAHRQGIVHRDVKPENILLSEGEPVLADFGIAKIIREGGTTGLTSAGMSLGTVTYMSPEQVTADPGLDGRADVYSLAAVGYELLSGRPPFTGTPAQVMSAHVVQPAPALGELVPESSSALLDAITRGLEKDAGRRPDAESFAALLEGADRSPAGPADGRAPATGPQERAAMPARGRRGRVIGGAAVLVAAALVAVRFGPSAARADAGPPTVAVLPFEMFGGDDDAYLSAGVADEIMTGLSQVEGLRVLSRTAVRAFADSSYSPAQYAERAGVRALVEGSVQRLGTQLRVTARLVDARDGSAMWSERYDRAVDDVFRTQQEISVAVANALVTRLGLSSGTAPRSEYVADPGAYDLFLRGRYALRERGETGLRTAVDLFSAAARRDPAFARAHAGIAEAAALLPIYANVTRASVADTIRASAARAIALDSLLAAPHVAIGLLEKGLGAWAAGERALVQALRLDPSEASAHQNLGELYFTLGRFDDSRRALEQAVRLEPTESAIGAEYAYALLHAGSPDSAARVVARAAIAAPRNPYVAYTQGVIAEAAGDAPAAARAMRVAADAAPLPFFRAALARALHLAGDTAAAATERRVLDSLGDAPGAAFARVIAALPFAAPDTLFDGLARAADEGDPFLVLLPLRVRWYDRIRADARFAALAARLGLPPEAASPLP